jgi:alpha-beta hydrolase superfamily lysophospholipase
VGVDTLEIDVLGEPYRRHIITLPDDDEGPVTATLISRRAPQPTSRAVLYLHGFNDYFFQTHLADFFTERGYDFYALDLRKYGRSLLPHQTPNFVRSLSEYFPELDEAARIIRAGDDHDTMVIFAHSTGGLIGSLWAHARSHTGVVDGMILNSPFFDINAPWIVRRPMAAVVGQLASRLPYRALPGKGPSLYGQSLHKDMHGEWVYDLAWKPVNSFHVRLGWLRAVRIGQQRLRAGLAIPSPILVAHSGASLRVPSWNEALHDADAVLNIHHIARWAPALGNHVTVVRIEGGKHDLTLSREPARQRFFTEASRWLNAYV